MKLFAPCPRLHTLWSDPFVYLFFPLVWSLELFPCSQVISGFWWLFEMNCVLCQSYLNIKLSTSVHLGHQFYTFQLLSLWCVISVSPLLTILVFVDRFTLIILPHSHWLLPQYLPPPMANVLLFFLPHLPPPGPFTLHLYCQNLPFRCRNNNGFSLWRWQRG